MLGLYGLALYESKEILWVTKGNESIRFLLFFFSLCCQAARFVDIYVTPLVFGRIFLGSLICMELGH